MSRTAPMLVDLRSYTIKPRGMAEFVEVFDRLAMPVLMATLGRPLGFYTSAVGELNQFVHLWAYDDFAEYERRGAARDRHPDFPAYLTASAHLVVAQSNRLIRSVPMRAIGEGAV